MTPEELEIYRAARAKKLRKLLHKLNLPEGTTEIEAHRIQLEQWMKDPKNLVEPTDAKHQRMLKKTSGTGEFVDFSIPEDLYPDPE